MTQRDTLIPETLAAEQLAVAVATLRRWRQKGRGPRFVKVGAAVRYDADELRAYIERNTRTSTRDVGTGLAE
jgi:predicted site-specific integrase-resolvase